MSELQRDYLTAKEIVRESIKGNPDASIFLSKAQKNLILCCLLRGYSKKIAQLADEQSVNGRLGLARDGKQVSQSLAAQADLILYSICSRVRDSWNGVGEERIPEDKTVLRSREVLSVPVKIISSDQDLTKAYGPLSRFMTGSSDEQLVRKEKKLLFKAKTSVPLICDLVPEKVLQSLNIESQGTKAVFLCFFKNRFREKVS